MSIINLFILFKKNFYDQNHSVLDTPNITRLAWVFKSCRYRGENDFNLHVIQDSCSWSDDKTYDTQSFVRHGNMTTLGWTCHTRAAPLCDMFKLESSYFHVPLTTVRHLLNVRKRATVVLTEIAGVDFDWGWKRRILHGWRLQRWTITKDIAEVDIAGVDNDRVVDSEFKL